MHRSVSAVLVLVCMQLVVDTAPLSAGDALVKELTKLMTEHTRAMDMDAKAGCTKADCGQQGVCDNSESAFGLPYVCQCYEGHGGHHCQFSHPCTTYQCPGGLSCIASNSNNVRGLICV